MIERSKRKDTDLSSYANIAASSRLPKAANVNGAPRGAATLRARPGISRAYRPAVTVGPVRKAFSANMNRAVARLPAIAKGIEPLIRSGFDLHPGIWAAAQLQAALAQSVWDMYLADPNAVPVGMMPGTRIVAGRVEWYCGATGTVTSAVGDPGGVPVSKTTAKNAYYWVGPNPVANQWTQVYGFTPDEISPELYGKRCLWHVNSCVS